MESTKTLREMCDELGVSRRTIQGYEKEGLVSASGRNKYGYLLYNEASQRKIAQIRLYQEFGFKVKEIKYLIDAPEQEFVESIKKQTEHLRAERVRIDGLIEKADEMLKSAEKPQSYMKDGGKNDEHVSEKEI